MECTFLSSLLYFTQGIRDEKGLKTCRGYEPCGLGIMGVPGPGGPEDPGGPCEQIVQHLKQEN